MTGGNSKTSVEASFDDGISWCYLPGLPRELKEHSQSGLVACGGYDVRNLCWTFGSGAWNQTHTLLHNRNVHTAWNSPSGVLLMGGFESELNTEILNNEGLSTESFSLDQRSGSSCAIELDTKVIITGGSYVSKIVRAYDSEGLIEDEVLPDLLKGRYSHGCGHYVNNDNKIVYLVTGGADLDTYQALSSTEILISGSETWLEVGDLPVPLVAMQGVSIHNTIILTGGAGQNFDAFNVVLSFNITSEEWHQVGEMREKRHSHGVSLVSAEDVSDFCSK